MAGVKGAGGPPPKRSDQRRRSNKTSGEERQASATKADGKTAEQPPADDKWHEVAKLWYLSLADSGQAAFYQASDWGLAYVLAETISRELNPQPVVVGSGEDRDVEMLVMPMKGATLSAFLKGCTALMVAEGDRRRAAVELTTPKPAGDQPTPSPVTSLAAWRQSLG